MKTETEYHYYDKDGKEVEDPDQAVRVEKLEVSEAGSVLKKTWYDKVE